MEWTSMESKNLCVFLWHRVWVGLHFLLCIDASIQPCNDLPLCPVAHGSASLGQRAVPDQGGWLSTSNCRCYKYESCCNKLLERLAASVKYVMHRSIFHRYCRQSALRVRIVSLSHFCQHVLLHHMKKAGPENKISNDFEKLNQQIQVMMLTDFNS